MKNQRDNKEVMAENLRRLMHEKGVSRMELCDTLGFNYNTVSDWLHARKYPRIDKIEAMAHYFGVAKADLVESPAERKNVGRMLFDILQGIQSGELVLSDGRTLSKDERLLLHQSIQSSLSIVRYLETKEK